MKSTQAEKDHSISQGELNKKFILIILPFTLFLSIPYFLFWNADLWIELKWIAINNFYYTFPVLIVGVALHEVLHGLSWAILSGKTIKSVKLGLSKKNLTPYCHFSQPLKLKYYIWGGLMPAIVLGLIPVIISWFNGSTGLFLFGLVFLLAAGSDILICLKLVRLDKDLMVQDYPDKPGCFIVNLEK